ncbi:MAG: guanylate kinase [Crocinitomicaceae bacterium]|nr:guanylate kinase [Crocinitomicaceae bacterium]
MKKGKCVIFSAPSGAGKTSIVNHLLSKGLNLEFSISACSRGPRGNEKDGKEYYFLGKDKFKELIRNDEFIEWEEVYRDNFYGTLKSEINRIWNSGKTVIFDVDVIGGLNLKKEFQKNALAIFVQPPSYQDLETRLRLRKTESEEKIKQRMAKARKELSFASEFDFILVNNDLLEACKQAEALIKDFIVKK